MAAAKQYTTEKLGRISDVAWIVGFLTHVLVSFALIISVLLQSGKGGGLSGTFGGSGVTGGVFGGRGAAPFLVKATTIFAVLFMLSAISLDFVKSESADKQRFAAHHAGE